MKEAEQAGEDAVAKLKAKSVEPGNTILSYILRIVVDDP